MTSPNDKCPICGKPATDSYKPFCAKRCADVDLNRWLSGGYAIPAVEQEIESDDDSGTGPPFGKSGGE